MQPACSTTQRRTFHTTFANHTVPASPIEPSLALHRSSSCRAPAATASRPSHKRIGGSSVALRVAAALASVPEPAVVLPSSRGSVRHTPAWYRFQKAAARGHAKARRESQLERWSHEATTGVSHKDRTNMLKMLVCEAYRFQSAKQQHPAPVKRAREDDAVEPVRSRVAIHATPILPVHIATPADFALTPPTGISPLSRHDFAELLADVETISEMMAREQTPPPATAKATTSSSAPMTGQPLWEHVVGELSRVHMWR